MKIVFENLDFSETLEIGFKGKHQLPLITIVRVYWDHDQEHMEVIDAKMIWSSSSLWHKPRYYFLRWINGVKHV